MVLTLPQRSSGFEVVTIGEPMVLLLAEPGVPLGRALTFHRSVAGSESNVAIGLARLGHTVQLQTRLSSDAFGAVIRSALQAEGVAVHAAEDAQRPTGVLIRDAHPQRQIGVIYHRAGSAASAIAIEDLDLEAVAGARVLHISGITSVLGDSPASAVAQAVRIAKASGTMISFDPNLRRRLCADEDAARILAPIVEQADIILAGDDESTALTGLAGDAAVEELLRRGPQLVVVKRGAAGAWATDGRQRWHQPPMPVQQIDPVGAGDAFAVGFLHGLLVGHPIEETLAVAARVASMVVTVNNDVDGLPTVAELQMGEGVQR